VERFPYHKTSNNLSKYHTTIYNNTTPYTGSIPQPPYQLVRLI
jgi:hypothetical protein